MSLLKYTYLRTYVVVLVHTMGTVIDHVAVPCIMDICESSGAMAACICFNTEASFPHGIMMHRAATIHFIKARPLCHRTLFCKI